MRPEVIVFPSPALDKDLRFRQRVQHLDYRFSSAGALRQDGDLKCKGFHLLLPALFQRPLEAGHQNLALANLDQAFFQYSVKWSNQGLGVWRSAGGCNLTKVPEIFGG